mgnify:CR=1 FL=1
MRMTQTYVENTNNHLEVQNAELHSKVAKLQQDVLMMKDAKAESERIGAGMIALLEDDRDAKLKMLDEALIAVDETMEKDEL